jgi:hypothetical protein
MGWWNTGLDDFWLGSAISVVYVVLLQGFIKAWFAVQASQQFVEDRRCGALELLLSSPLTVREMVSGQWRALRGQFLRPVVFMIAAQAFLLVAVVVYGDRHGRDWTGLGAANIVLIPLDMWALGWTAMAGTMSASRYQSAAMGAIASVLLLPWLAALAFRHSVFFWDSRRVALGWLLLGVALDLVLGWRSRRRLLRDFRASASARYSKERPGRLRSLLARRREV